MTTAIIHYRGSAALMASARSLFSGTDESNYRAVLSESEWHKRKFLVLPKLYRIPRGWLKAMRDAEEDGTGHAYTIAEMEELR